MLHVNAKFVMQYISPIALLKEVSPGEVDNKNLTIAKKKLLAELDLSGGASIIINNRELFKNDIINFFDSLQQHENINYHIIVANDAVLLRFLEHNVIENGNRFTNTELYRNEQFINWVSGYYCTSFCIVAANCLTYIYDDEWLALMANPLLMNATDLEEAWGEVETEVRQSLERLREFFNSKSVEGKKGIDLLVGFRYISMLQRLPAQRFTILRDEYAYMVMQCSIEIFNKVNKDEGLIIVENGLILAASENIRRQIGEKMSEMQSINSRRKKRSSWSGRGLGILIFIIIRIIWYSASSSGNSDYNFQNTIPVYNYKNDTGLQRLLDTARVEIDSAQEKHHFDSLVRSLKKMKPGPSNP